MRIENIELSSYRNFSHLKVEFSAGVNVIVGPNGQGKTNLLEAIYLSARGQSFRPGNNATVIQKKAELIPAVGKIQFNDADLAFALKFQIEERKKTFLLNQKKVSSTLLAKKMPLVLFSPESLSSIKDGPEARRNLLDDATTLIDATNLRLLSEFKRCLRTRNKVLKDLKQGLQTTEKTKEIINSINPSYFRLSTEVAVQRIAALRDLTPYLLQAFKAICQSSQIVDISVDYEISSHSAIDWNHNQVYDAISSRNQELSLAELDSGMSLVGPHKHDVKFLFGGEDSRYFCSQGQQRALILAFKMAQVIHYKSKVGTYPVLLLDDVLSELDEEKRRNLVRFLSQVQSQIFITTTEFDMSEQFLSNDLRLFLVKDGNIKGHI